MPDRPRLGGVLLLVVALLAAAASALVFAGSLLMQAVSSYNEIDAAAEPGFLIFNTVASAAGGLTVALFGFLLLALGRALWAGRHWARQMTLGLAILSASFFSVLGLLSLASLRWTGALVHLPVAAFSGWVISYLNQPAIRETFAPATPPAPPPSNPEES